MIQAISPSSSVVLQYCGNVNKFERGKCLRITVEGVKEYIYIFLCTLA